jgi:hypothetical protein
MCGCAGTSPSGAASGSVRLRAGRGRRAAVGAGSPARSAAAVARALKRSLNAASASACCTLKPSTRAASRTALRPRQVICSHTIAACSRP